MRHSILLLICACLRLPGADFFIQLSDPQMGMFAKNANTVQDETNLQFAAANINRLKPAFVVVTGDLVNIPGDSVQVGRYLGIVRSIDAKIPVYNVPGNHDVNNEPTAESLAAYRKAFGKDYYTFDAGSVRGIVLDSSLIQHPAKSPDEAAKQEAWLVSELKRAQREKVAHIIVFQHIPFFLEKADEPDQYFNIPLEARKRFLAWFHEYGVKNVFAGHYHRNSYGRDGDLEMVTSGPVGMPLEQAQSGIRVVEVDGPAVKHHYYELGVIPNVLGELK